MMMIIIIVFSNHVVILLSLIETSSMREMVELNRVTQEDGIAYRPIMPIEGKLIAERVLHPCLEREVTWSSLKLDEPQLLQRT